MSFLLSDKKKLTKYDTGYSVKENPCFPVFILDTIGYRDSKNGHG